MILKFFLDHQEVNYLPHYQEVNYLHNLLTETAVSFYFAAIFRFLVSAVQKPKQNSPLNLSKHLQGSKSGIYPRACVVR